MSNRTQHNKTSWRMAQWGRDASSFVPGTFHKRGRFGPHNPPHMKAPGKPHPGFTAYAWFNAGLQIFDVSNPREPKSTGYFIPGQAGTLDDYLSYPRDTDAVFVEWDRKLMWVGTGTGIYLVTSPLLGQPVLKPMEVAEWSIPGLNLGHP